MLVDANLLLYAVDETSTFHERAHAWLTDMLNGPCRVGFPWMSLVAFMRISTNARATTRPLTSSLAAGFVRDWLSADAAWTPGPGPRHGEIVLSMFETGQLSGNLVSDAHLAAIAVEHGLVLASNDSDFARFSALRWENPLAG
ncbi:MAG: type II toxin-antitoxin system VapC family toxin [Acidimicrobiia bacterium]